MRIAAFLSATVISLSSFALTIPQAPVAPNIDGRLDDPLWKTAPACELKPVTNAPLRNRTLVQAAYDPTRLYVAFTCFEARMDQLKANWTHHEERDNQIWQDDCVEVFVTPAGSANEVYHWIVNSAGIFYDALNNDAGWDSTPAVAARREKDRWTVEIAISFDDLGGAPAAGKPWRANFAREEKPVPELSALSSARGSFNDPQCFGPLKFQGLRDTGTRPADRRRTGAADSTPSLATTRPSRVWTIEKPLYRELFSKEPLGLVKVGALYWPHEIDHGRMRPFALQYGLPYGYDDFLAQIARHRFTPYVNSYVLRVPYYQARAAFKRHGIQAVLMLDFRGAPVAHSIDGYPFLPDPAAKAHFLDSLKAVEKYKDVVWAVSAGDEIHEHDELRGVNLFATQRESYEFIRHADEQIKKQYGQGVYGIPLNKDDKNPYRWIAYRRWLNDQYADVFTAMYKRVKQIDPRLLVVSCDPIAFHHPYDFSRWKEFADILTHQLYPARTSTRADFGFITKLITDISGLKEVWPCMHVEEYAASLTPEEVVELISQCFRNGATGIHYFPIDTIGRRAQVKYLHTEYYGAPDRWQVQTALLAEARQMNRLRFPPAKCAILYSCDSYAALPPGPPSSEVEAAYTLLGPLAGSWFRFIDDNQVERGTVNLADFKVLYIPLANYQRAAVVEKIAAYIRNGGTVICGDPEAFAHDVHGKDLSHWRTTLFGAETKERISPAPVKFNGAVLPLFSAGYRLSPAKAARILARHVDGSPAIVTHACGKGRTVFFSTNPFHIKALRNPGWKAAFTRLQNDYGIQTNQPIWRFQFPMSLIKSPPRPNGRCLTNNHIDWRGFQPLTAANIDTGGAYSYAPAPDAVPDVAQGPEIPFSKGKLTNRRQAPAAGNVDCYKSTLDQWVVRYDKPDPFSIRFDLKKAYPIRKVNVVYSGRLPRITLEASSDGGNWVALAETAGHDSPTPDVRVKELTAGRPEGEANFRYARLNFGSRPGTKEHSQITLSEVELWTKQPPNSDRLTMTINGGNRQ